MESEELIMEVAEKVSSNCKNLGIPYIFKSSYRKANRTSGSSFTGLGDDIAMFDTADKALEFFKNNYVNYNKFYED